MLFSNVHSGWGIKCEILTPAECQAMCPMIEIGDLEGGLWVPEDGVADQKKLCTTLMNEAVDRGVTVVEQCAVTEVQQKDGRVVGVNTTSGHTR
jgi:pyruvate dehydrogenase phosphatase regulatory subunit